jgi:hypothetical protein
LLAPYQKQIVHSRVCSERLEKNLSLDVTAFGTNSRLMYRTRMEAKQD